MTLISYAQNFEDVLLWRALGHVDRGLYVDVGAQHPRVDSVSQLFHDQGWQGIHIEPSPDYAALLRAGRPGDEVIEAALSAERGRAVFHEIKGTGLSTLASAAMDSATARGFEVFDHPVRTLLLDDVLDSVDDPIHWLKIDVEGHERSVIEGWTGVVRPWVLLIESTLPGSRVEAYQNWEPDILSKGYHFVWFDGLNRFYVHDNHADLNAHFRAPPNVFDSFVLSGEASSSFANHLNERACQLEKMLSESEQAATERLKIAERAAADHAATLSEQAESLAEAAAERSLFAQRVAEKEAARAKLEAALEASRAMSAIEIARLQQQRDRLSQDSDAVRQQLSERTFALEAAQTMAEAAEREAAKMLTLAAEARQSRDREDADRARLEARIEVMRVEHGAALDALGHAVKQAMAEDAITQQRLNDAAVDREHAQARETIAVQEAAVAGALLAEIRSRIAAITTEAARQRRADLDVVIRLRADHAAERQRMDAAQVSAETLFAEQQAALVAAKESEWVATLEFAQEGNRQAALLADARADARVAIELGLQDKAMLQQYTARLSALARMVSGADSNDFDDAFTAIEAILSASRAPPAVPNTAGSRGAWLRSAKAHFAMRRDRSASNGSVYAAAQKSCRQPSDANSVRSISAGANLVRNLRSFWSRDAVADRVDAVVAALATQFQVSLDEGLSGVREDVRRVSERCEAIIQRTASIETIGEALPKLLSTADHLVDIALANVHQTAIVQQTLDASFAPTPDTAATEPADAAVRATTSVDYEEVARLTPMERQILDNFLRALNAVVS